MTLRILMLAHRVPYPPDTGDKVRAFHIARRDLGRAARAFVCAHHAWPAVLGVLDDVLRTLAAPGVRQGARP
jgi:hypothetical protein